MARHKRKQLEPVQYRAVAFLVSKDAHGMTNEQIAEELGINPATLYRWRKEPLFNDELIKQAEELQRTFLVETYGSLRSIIANPKVKDGTKLKAIELMLRNQGRLKDVQEQTVHVEERSIDEMLKELDSL